MCNLLIARKTKNKEYKSSFDFTDDLVHISPSSYVCLFVSVNLNLHQPLQLCVILIIKFLGAVLLDFQLRKQL